MSFLRSCALLGIVATSSAFAADGALTVTIHSVSETGVGDKIGIVTVEETSEGLKFTPNLKGLRPGERGFHVHEKGSCTPSEKDGKLTAAGSAGGHYDPESKGEHRGPHGDGHRGDLPTLVIADDGTATSPVISKKLTLKEVRGRSLMIHEGADNYSDSPKPLGGGGGRIACGVIE